MYWRGRGSDETAVMRKTLSFRCSHMQLKTTVDCASLSSKCTYVLNGVAKALAKLLKCAYSSELSLLAHSVD